MRRTILAIAAGILAATLFPAHLSARDTTLLYITSIFGRNI
jgi:hypothetical protein